MFSYTFNKSIFRQFLLLALGIGVVLYATYVLVHVSTSYEIGIRSVLTPNIIGKPLNVKDGNGPESGDLIWQVGDLGIATWAELLDAPQRLHEKILSGQTESDWYYRSAET